jgi:hypothetical protein
LKRDSIAYGFLITRPRVRLHRQVVGSLAITVHVGDESHIPLSREPARFVVHMLGDAPPFGHHHDSGSLRRFGGVVHDETLHRGRAVVVRDRRLLDRGEHRGGHRERDQHAEKLRFHGFSSDAFGVEAISAYFFADSQRCAPTIVLRGQWFV